MINQSSQPRALLVSNRDKLHNVDAERKETTSQTASGDIIVSPDAISNSDGAELHAQFLFGKKK